jgi:hypothetical protein
MREPHPLRDQQQRALRAVVRCFRARRAQECGRRPRVSDGAKMLGFQCQIALREPARGALVQVGAL